MSTFIEKAAQVLGKDRVKQLQNEGHIAAQIKTRRKELAYSQEELAQKTGLQKLTIGQIEAGLNSPSAATLTLIAKALDMDIVIRGKESVK
ncbi:helix-turn-helix domain-containing protein [Planococcus donghaensis]|uniref:helix-turn-helix domain-containing protein n=1 Tax=Planococcus donghaensis TaxID=414778 RepID=UPI003735E80D